MKGAILLGAERGDFRHLLPREERLNEMNKTFQYRLYPTKLQQTMLNEWLELCCETYYAALQVRRDAYRLAGVPLSYAQQCAELPGCKDVRPELGEVNSQVLQDALKRVDRAFENFYRRCAAGDKSGYPRFRSRLRSTSLTFKQYGNSFSLQRGKKLRGTLLLSKLGHIKMVMHRPITGLPKTATVKRTPMGKWFVSICVATEGASIPFSPSQEHRGSAWGGSTFAYLSAGERFDNPRFFREEEHALARAQHDQKPARWRRESWMRCGRHFSHTISSCAAEAGREVVRVNAAYTSQTCSACGHRQEMPLSVQVYECTACGLIMDRDYNGSKNILEEALEAMGRHGCVIPEAPGAGAAGSRHRPYKSMTSP